MSKEELYEKWPVLRMINMIPEEYTCCWGCATQFVASVAGWPAANDWESVMWEQFYSPRDVS